MVIYRILQLELQNGVDRECGDLTYVPAALLPLTQSVEGPPAPLDDVIEALMSADFSLNNKVAMATDYEAGRRGIFVPYSGPPLGAGPPMR